MGQIITQINQPNNSKSNTLRVMKKVDVFVIGSGSAGRKVAQTCAKSGLKVAIADNRDYGGTCGNRGCIPKKVLLGPSETYDLADNLMGKGISTMPIVDWKALQKFKRQFTKPIPMSTEYGLYRRRLYCNGICPYGRKGRK